jgi:ABC-type nitrate/sulfonate/bicarbonate transport system substrate-binding protein
MTGLPSFTGGFLDVVFRKWLADKGVDSKQITYVETSFPQMSDLLKANQVDAVVAVDPFLSRIIDQKNGYFVDDCTKTLPDGTIASVFMATSKWAADHPDVVKAFQEAIAEAAAFEGGAGASNEGANFFSTISELALRAQNGRHGALPEGVPCRPMSQKLNL